MRPIQVFNEIAPLKKVLLHRTGDELLYLTPSNLNDLLFDDIPYLKGAQKEHDNFAAVLKSQGVEVVYLEDLMTEVLNNNPSLREPFLKQFIVEAGIHTKRYQDLLYSIYDRISDNRKLVLKTMSGLNVSELQVNADFSLVERIANESDLVIQPLPNLYFTRDSFACIGNGVSLNRMYSLTRRRETIYGSFIFRHHPEYKDKVPLYYDRTSNFHIEGGDISNLNGHTLTIGISQRTEADAIEELADHVFFRNETGIDRILAFHIPATRAFMHLDTVFTQIDYDKFTVHPGILGTLEVYLIEPGAEESLKISRIDDSLDRILAKELGLSQVELIQCGNGDRVAAEREQWNDGSNTLCIAPGKIIVYNRNEVTNRALRKAGLEVLEIESSELSRGRGGPRCMSMPLQRDL